MENLNTGVQNVSSQHSTIEDQSHAIAEVYGRLITDKGRGIAKSIQILKDAGLNIKASSNLINPDWLNGNTSLSTGNTGAGGGEVTATTFTLEQQLIQDITPNNDITLNSPLNEILPFKNVGAMTMQQDILASNYGVASASRGVGGIFNVVPMLKYKGKQWQGYTWGEMQEYSGNMLVSLRELGTSNTEKQGIMQQIVFNNLNMYQRLITRVQLIGWETLLQGGYEWNPTGQVSPNVPFISAQLPPTSFYDLGCPAGMFTFTKATNRLTIDPVQTFDVLKAIGNQLTYIRNMGSVIDSILISNVVYNALYQTLQAQGKTAYISAVSSNDVQAIRKNIFRINNIPALQGVDFEIYSDSWKFEEGDTTELNTRPLMFGEVITPNSFNLLVKIKPQTSKTASIIGNIGFFPNVYGRVVPQGAVTRDMGNGMVLVTQDLAQFDIKQQTIQTVTAMVCNTMVYLPHLVKNLSLNVTVV